jgi:uncharacterized membrane protein
VADEEEMMDKSVLRVARGAIIAAAYVGLVAALPWISFGMVQFRIAEALTILPFFWPEAIFGVTIGCLASNLIFGGLGIVDTVLGTLATLLAAILTWQLGKTKQIWLGALPPIILNALIVGFYLPVLLMPDAVLNGFDAFTNLFKSFQFVPFVTQAGLVGLGEIVSVGIIGLALAYALNKRGLLERD